MIRLSGAGVKTPLNGTGVSLIRSIPIRLCYEIACLHRLSIWFCYRVSTLQCQQLCRLHVSSSTPQYSHQERCQPIPSGFEPGSRLYRSITTCALVMNTSKLTSGTEVTAPVRGWKKAVGMLSAYSCPGSLSSSGGAVTQMIFDGSSPSTS